MLKHIEKMPSWLADTEDKNLGTLWQVVKAFQANKRQGTVGVKTRAQVVSTGKKPYKQKKTGSARRGSFVSPLHVGGGVAHGPKARDHRQAIPAKMNAAALKLALAARIDAGTVFQGKVAIDSGKTKDAKKALGSALPKVGKTVVCLEKPSAETIRAVRNLRGVEILKPEQLNALHVMEARGLVISTEAMAVLEKRLASAK